MKERKFVRKIIDYTRKNGNYVYKADLLNLLKVDESEFIKLKDQFNCCFRFEIVNGKERYEIFPASCREQLNNLPSIKEKINIAYRCLGLIISIVAVIKWIVILLN